LDLQESKDFMSNINVCPHAEKCGGCFYQGVAYDEQLAVKNSQVLGFLEDNGVVCGEYYPVKASPHILGYRNKMEYSFGDEVKGGELNLGLYRKRSYMSVITTDDCMIVPRDFDTLRRGCLAYMREKGHTHRSKKFRTGFLRNFVVRRGEFTGELLVNLVTTSAEVLDEEAFVGMLRSLPLEGELVGVLHTIFDGRADTVGCDSQRVLFGREYYLEKMPLGDPATSRRMTSGTEIPLTGNDVGTGNDDGLLFNVHALSFFQTNTAAASAMFAEAFTMLPDLSDKHVFDIYCGAGSISLAIAGRARRVIGIEIVEDSVNSARENASLNGITNADFICGDAFEVMDSLDVRPDAVIVDPPRMGMHPKALGKLISYGLPEILYISCNPKTFSADMKTLNAYGYKLETLRAYDNFPFTKHIELAARIVKA
jgi:tRNA/tmRNA/rRNA uracil-C5-methylase (TrmA/RlmC/RlmD family)